MLAAPAPDRLAPYFHRLRETPLLEKRGHVTQVIGLVIESAGPLCAVGDVCRIEPSSGENILAEVVGFRRFTAFSPGARSWRSGNPSASPLGPS
jgi:flagellar biosynthesis/type III secretory pathway ATPase